FTPNDNADLAVSAVVHGPTQPAPLVVVQNRLLASKLEKATSPVEVVKAYRSALSAPAAVMVSDKLHANGPEVAQLANWFVQHTDLFYRDDSEGGKLVAEETAK